MPTVKLVEETAASPRVQAVFDDIKAAKKIDRVPLAVVGLYNQLNKLADAFQVEPDLLPKVD